MSWNYIMGLISSIALFLPITLIFALRLAGYRTFPALLLYYILVAADNLLAQGAIGADKSVVQFLGIGNNMLDAPLMLFFLTYFSNGPTVAKRMKIYILLFILFEITIVLLRGYNVKAVVIIMAPGLLSVLLFSFYFFIRQTKITIMHRKATGKALIVSSLLFAYGCYSIIYLMFYIFKTPNKAETFGIYFLVTTFSVLLMSAGLVIERKRVQRLEELKVTRKELSVVYKQTEKPITLIPAREKERFN